MEFVPRHPHAIPPPTSPDRLSWGAAVRRSGPVSPPDRVPARAETPRGHRQTHHTPDCPLAACRVSASCRVLPSQHQRGRTATRDDTRTHEPLATGGTPLRMGLPHAGHTPSASPTPPGPPPAVARAPRGTEPEPRSASHGIAPSTALSASGVRAHATASAGDSQRLARSSAGSQDARRQPPHDGRDR